MTDGSEELKDGAEAEVDDLGDVAFEKDNQFEKIASELFEVDKNGILLQGLLSLMIASTASIGSNVAAGVGLGTTVMIFVITFLPNFGLKVVAELIKKRALVRGMREGYKKGRKDGLLNDSAYMRLTRWSQVYKMLESATFGGGA